MVMKKTFKSLLVIIAVMVAFAGCQKEEVNAPAAETKTVQFFAESIETKTAFGTPNGTTYPTLWTANDKAVKLLLNLNEEFTADVTVADDFKTASFNTEVTLKDSEAPYTFYAMSPASAYLGKTADRYSATIPTTQKPLENSVDEAAQILYAVSEEFNEIPNTVSLNFKHFTAYGKLSFVNLELGDAKVTSIAISSTDVKLAGRWNYVVADGSFTENSGATEITLDTDKTENLWFACAPVGSMDGKKLKFTVNTDKGPLSKEVTLSGEKYNFEAGHIAKMKVDMEGIKFAESKVYELVTDADALTVDSKIIIVAKDYDYALSTTQNGNNRGQAAVTKVDNKIENPGDGVQVLTVGEGYAEGTLSFSTGQQYLFAPGGGNYLRSTTTLNDNASWTVTIADGVATIKANRSGKNWMRYNSTSSIFSCYDSGQKDIVIYKLQGSGTVKENYLDVPATIEVEATATAAPISVKSDLAWTASASDGATLDKVSATGNADVNVTFSANTSSETKTYTVTFTADGIEKVVTITQAAVEPETPVFASLAELIATIEPTTTATKVTVTLTDEEITGIFTTSSGYRNGVFLQVGEKEIEIYCYNVPTEWEVGGTVSGTLTECDWKLYNTTWELCPADWSELTYTAPAESEPETPGTGGADGDDTTGGTHYVKVTSAPTDWTGDYLIVYEVGSVAFDGSLTTLDAVNNTVSVVIEDGKIEATDAMKSSQFTIDASGIVKSASGYYIGQTSDANGLKSSQSTKYTNTISVNNDGTVNIVSGGAYLRYNATSGQYRFRYYKSSSYTGQKAIQLYKLN